MVAGDPFDVGSNKKKADLERKAAKQAQDRAAEKRRKQAETTIKRELAQFEGEITNLERDIKGYKGNLDTWSRELKRLTSMLAEGHNEERRELEHDKTELAKARQEIRSLQDEQKREQGELAKLTREHHSTLEKLSSAKGQLAQLTRRLHEAEIDKKAQDSDSASHKSALSSSKSKERELKAKESELATELSHDEVGISSLRAKVEREEAKLRQLENMIRADNDMLRNLEKSKARHTQEHDQVVQDLSELDQMIDKEEAAVSRSSKSKVPVDAIKRDVSKVEQFIRELESRQGTLTSDIKRLEQEITREHKEEEMHSKQEDTLRVKVTKEEAERNKGVRNKAAAKRQSAVLNRHITQTKLKVQTAERNLKRRRDQMKQKEADLKKLA